MIGGKSQGGDVTVHGHEKVPVSGQVRSPLVAKESPHPLLGESCRSGA